MSMTAEFAGNQIDYTAGPRDPLGRRPARHRRGGEAAARRRKAPMIIAGQGVLYAEASDELLALAELLDIPVMTTTDGKSAFPEDHALALGSGGIVYTGHGPAFPARGRRDLRDRHVSLTQHNISTPIIPPGKTIIHATNDARDLYKANDTALPILGDAKLVLAQLIEAVKDRLGRKTRSRPTRASEIARLRDEWLGRWEAEAALRRAADQPVPRDVANSCASIPSEDAIVTHDSGSPRDQLLPFYRATKPRGYIGWGKSHQLGTGLGLAIGAKVAAPDKFCVNFMGDAAFGMTGLDFETAVRCGIPITTIVLNNSTMAIETHAMALSHEKLQHPRSRRQLRQSRRAISAAGASGSSDPARSAMRSAAPAARTRTAAPRCSNSSPAPRPPSPTGAVWRSQFIRSPCESPDPSLSCPSGG